MRVQARGEGGNSQGASGQQLVVKGTSPRSRWAPKAPRCRRRPIVRKHQKHYPECLTWGESLAVWPTQAAAAFALGAPCLGVLSLVRETHELNYCTRLFHQTVHALSATSCKTSRCTNVVCCFFGDPALEAQPRHEVAVGMGRNEPVAHDTTRPSARLSGVHHFEDPVVQRPSY